MKKIALTILSICLALFSFGQTIETEKLIELGKAYKNFRSYNEPPQDFLKNLQMDTPDNLKLASNFISEAITSDNDLLNKKFISLPDSQTLKIIYIIISIHHNVSSESQVDNKMLVESLKIADIERNNLVWVYYSTLFSAVSNKIKPFNFSKIDFKLNEYNLSNDTEKGIFFLECMNSCGATIFGFMNMAKPPNTGKAYAYIKKFPRFNSLEYYQFTDLNFPDFEIYFQKDKSQSYKSLYIDSYYDLLLSHLTCLNAEGAKDKEIKNLLYGSILKDRSLYKYSRQKEKLESLFKEWK